MWREQSGICLAEGFILGIRHGCHPCLSYLASGLVQVNDLFPVITSDPLLGGFWEDSVRSQGPVVLILIQGRKSDTTYS